MPDYVSAYRSGYSTETVLFRLSDEMLQNMDRQCVMPLVAVDLSAAFDTVEHRILKDVLYKKYSVEGTVLKWFENYLANREVKGTDKLLCFRCIKFNNICPSGTC